jgi:ribonuclease-3
LKLFESFIKQLKNHKINPLYHSLEQRIGYHFQNQSLLEAALFHPSAHSEQHEIPPFERMEFLGDAVLGLVVSEELFIKNPNFQEGELSKLKSKLVSRKYLALKAKEIGLGNFITLSKEAENNGGRESVTIVGNAMEAFICAIYLDGSFEDARKFIKTFILDDIKSATKLEKLINYKSRLQEYFQAKSPVLPTYKVINEEGPDHARIFTVQVFMKNELLGEGTGKTKKEAEQSAAKKAMEKIQE